MRSYLRSLSLHGVQLYGLHYTQQISRFYSSKVLGAPSALGTPSAPLTQKDMLSLLALTAALASRSAVTPSYLRLRGGDVDTVTNGMALLQVASGTFAFMAPERNIEMYGYDKEPTKVEVAMMRYLAVGQVVLGATSVAGLEGGSKAAQAMSLSGGAASLLACAPVFEALGGNQVGAGGC